MENTQEKYKRPDIRGNKNPAKKLVVKNKISEKMQGNKNGSGKRTIEFIKRNRENHKGKLNGMFGKKRSIESRNITSKKVSGVNNPAWKGGRTNRWFKKKVTERDGNICNIFQMEDKEILVLDHIKPKSISPELKYIIENMQILCPNCHARKTNREKKEIALFKKLNSKNYGKL